MSTPITVINSLSIITLSIAISLLNKKPKTIIHIYQGEAATNGSQPTPYKYSNELKIQTWGNEGFMIGEE